MSEAKRLVRSDTLDPVELASVNYPVLRRVGPSFLTAFTLSATPASGALVHAVEIVRDLHAGRRRKLPTEAPTSFVRQGWRRQLLGAGEIDRRAYELCVFVELRDRLRAGDVWVEGSRQDRAVEQQLIPKPVFAAMRAVGPLPISAPDSVQAWLRDRRALLGARLAEVGGKAERGALEDVRLDATGLRVTPLRAVTPEAAESLVGRLYAMLPSVRVTDLLAEVDGWTGFSSSFTHLNSGRAADDPRVVLTGVLGLRHQPRAHPDGRGLQPGHPATALLARVLAYPRGHLWPRHGPPRRRPAQAAARPGVQGAGFSSSSDGQHFPLDRRAEATGDVNPRKGSEPAVSFYTHVSDRYAPFHGPGDLGRGRRGRTRARRPALPRRRPEHPRAPRPAAGASPTTSSPSVTCSASASLRASRTWPPDGYTSSTG